MNTQNRATRWLFFASISFVVISFVTNSSAHQIDEPQPSSNDALTSLAAIHPKADRSFLGKAFSKASESANQPLTLVQFWASWCHSCYGFMYDLDELSKNNQLQYIAINIDDTIDTATKYLQKHPLYPNNPNRFWFDDAKQWQSLYQVKTVPTVMIVDRDWNIHFKTSGHLNSEDYLAIKQVVIEHASAPSNKQQ